MSGDAPISGNRILIVEDERIVARNLEQKLQKLGYVVVGRASSCKAALDCARRGRPDLALMDINIEGPQDGVETARLLWEQLGIRVIYLTAYSEDQTLDRARATRPYGYLLKPFSDRELHATLQMALERRRADVRLAQSEQRERLALETAGMGTWEFVPKGSELRPYGLATGLIGVKADGDALELGTFLNCVHEADRDRVRLAIEGAAQSREPCTVEFRHAGPGERERWLRLVGRVCEIEGEGPARVIGVAQDISERHATERRLQQASTVFNETKEGIFILDAQRKLISGNPSFYRMTGTSREQADGHEVSFLSNDSATSPEPEQIWKTLEKDGAWHGETRALRDNGEPFPAHLSVTVARGSGGDDVHYIGILTDFTELRSAQEALRRLAHFDSLTGLPNRLLAHDRLGQAVNRARRRSARVAVLFLDLDRFKRINDTRGHTVGDEVLREIARRIPQCLRTEDTAARLGGDEFLVVIDEYRETGHLIAVAEKLRHALAFPVTAGGQEFHVSVSIGIAQFPDDADTVERLIQCADTAMYEAKARGRGSYAFYNPDMTRRVARYLSRDQLLHAAFTQGQLRVHYQPQLEAATGRLSGTEALVRWQHPELGLLGAAEVVPAAEESGLILDIGAWVLDTVCHQAARWARDFGTPLKVGVNVSGVQIANGRVPDEVARALKASGLDPRLLEIELTESTIQHEDSAVPALKAIRALGVHLAIDDFGTGFSCLSSLRHLPLDRLKIDRSFVESLPDDPNAMVLTDTVISIARRLGLGVTAEGVENEGQFGYLKEKGCDTVQGWFFGRAEAAESIDRHLRSALPTPS